MATKQRGVEKHAEQLQKSNSSSGMSSKLPDFSFKVWLLIGLAVAFLVLILWWRSKGGDTSNKPNNNGDDGDDGGDIRTEDEEDENIEEEADTLDITIEDNPDDPLENDRKMMEEMKADGVMPDIIPEKQQGD